MTMANIIAEKKQLTYYYFYAIYNYIFFFFISGEKIMNVRLGGIGKGVHAPSSEECTIGWGGGGGIISVNFC